MDIGIGKGFTMEEYLDMICRIYGVQHPPFKVADSVNQPSHYTEGGIETIDFIRAKLTVEQFEGYCLGNAMKYLSRAGKKEDASKDKAKAEWYLQHLRNGSKKLSD